MSWGERKEGIEMYGFHSSEALNQWVRACNYHRGTNLNHKCKNPSACMERLNLAFSLEMANRGWE